MIYSQSAKRSFDIFSKSLRNHVQSGHFNSFRASIIPQYANQNGFMVRNYGSEAPVSEQMSLIKKLRERTSAPIKEVKAALVTCNWDLDAAQKDLRKRGVILASKKSARTAAEGLLALAQNENKAAVIELNCETDFVARNDIFRCLAASLAKLALLVDNSQQLSGAFPIGPEYFEMYKPILEI